MKSPWSIAADAQAAHHATRTGTAVAPPTATAPAETRYAINPAGVIFACLGALAMVVSAFLPLDEPDGTFTRIQSNTLIQHGGWLLIALGVGIGLAAYRSYSTGKRGWTVVVLGLIGIAIAIVIGTNKDYRTLYAITADGSQTGDGTVVPLGIAVYVAGAGAALAALGGRVMRQAPSGSTPPVQNKACPDCAETVLADANVCKHCGYRFAPATQEATAA